MVDFKQIFACEAQQSSDEGQGKETQGRDRL